MMMIYAIYDTQSGQIRQSIDIPEFLKGAITMSDSESLVEIPRMAHDTTEYIKDGVLTQKLIADQPS